MAEKDPDAIPYLEQRARRKMAKQCGIKPEDIPKEMRWPRNYARTEVSGFWLWTGRIFGGVFGVFIGLFAGVFAMVLAGEMIGLMLGAFVGILVGGLLAMKLGNDYGWSRPRSQYNRIYLMFLNRKTGTYHTKWIDPMMPRMLWPVLFKVDENMQLADGCVFPARGRPVGEARLPWPQRWHNLTGSKRWGQMFFEDGAIAPMKLSDMYPEPKVETRKVEIKDDKGKVVQTKEYVDYTKGEYCDVTPLLLKEFVLHDPAVGWMDSMNKKLGNGSLIILAIVGAVVGVIVLKLLGVV